ncbi:MAG: tRNA (adenosine(37)-N6)-dimethylallyltransferase MiaA [Planctomycetes bacterium]|nr:tRNA (adenosine(37)-N6)-dimethylallyltransferase MiaA [Planctomycetota bacterium]
MVTINRTFLKNSLNFDNKKYYMPHTICILTGPTASGKSEIAVKIAEKTGAAIVSADSMLIYRGMDIGTEKPSREVRNKIPHYLIDIRDPWEEYSVGNYIKDFEDVTNNLYAQEKPFIVVGGTALYLKAIMEGLFNGPPANWEYRNHLKKVVREQGAGSLYAMLEAIDPKTANRLHTNDQRRIIRALEVFKQTGIAISSYQTQFGNKNPNYNCIIAAIAHDRKELYKRIETRVDSMFSRGLIDEVQTLMLNPLGLSKQASQALGYKEVIDYLEGNYSLQEVIDAIKQGTRRFAKRQMTWFRSFSDVYWITADAFDDKDAFAENILDYFAQKKPFIEKTLSY